MMMMLKHRLLSNCKIVEYRDTNKAFKIFRSLSVFFLMQTSVFHTKKKKNRLVIVTGVCWMTDEDTLIRVQTKG